MHREGIGKTQSQETLQSGKNREILHSSGYTFLPEKYVFSSYNSFLEMDKYGLKDFEERYPFDRVSIRDDF